MLGCALLQVNELEPEGSDTGQVLGNDLTSEVQGTFPI